MPDKLNLDQHISRGFNEDLEAIRTHCLNMGGLVERQLEDAIRAMIDGDSELAEEVLAREKQVNRMEVAIDEECASVVARRQPAASDLRLVLVVSKAVRDLERVGDESKKIAKMSIKLIDEGEAPRGYYEIRHIGETARDMVHDALNSFARFDTELALAVCQRDKELDRDYKTAVRELITYMMEDPRSISRVMNIMWTLRALERIGDHSRNIAEYVFYLVKGKDYRHVGLEKLAEAAGTGELSRTMVTAQPAIEGSAAVQDDDGVPRS